MWGFQFDVQDAGSSVWFGGTEHMISRYDKATMRRTYSAITREGGDFQDLHLNGNIIYGACHCGDYIYQNSTTWEKAWESAQDAQTIRLVAAFDKDSGQVSAGVRTDYERCAWLRCVGVFRGFYWHSVGWWRYP